jgi:Flp pilus assembly pilin Flp
LTFLDPIPPVAAGGRDPLPEAFTNMIEKIRTSVRRKKNDRGASAVEYALIMGLIVAAVIGVLTLIGVNAASNLDKACKPMNSGQTCNP